MPMSTLQIRQKQELLLLYKSERNWTAVETIYFLHISTKLQSSFQETSLEFIRKLLTYKNKCSLKEWIGGNLPITDILHAQLTFSLKDGITRKLIECQKWKVFVFGKHIFPQRHWMLVLDVNHLIPRETGFICHYLTRPAAITNITSNITQCS